MKDIEKFSAFMEGYVAFLEEMAQGEGEKYAALLSYEAKRVDRVVSRQQAMNMRLSQLEEQREREQEEAGLGGLSFQEILARLDKYWTRRSRDGCRSFSPGFPGRWKKSNTLTENPWPLPRKGCK